MEKIYVSIRVTHEHLTMRHDADSGFVTIGKLPTEHPQLYSQCIYGTIKYYLLATVILQIHLRELQNNPEKEECQAVSVVYYRCSQNVFHMHV